MDDPTTAESRPGWARIEGDAHILGARWIAAERAWNFALYSKHAHRVTLLLYVETDIVTPAAAFELDPGRHKSGRVWHCRISEADTNGARYYAYRVSGPPPEGPFAWHAFDSEKILLDPYARAIHFPAGFERGAAMHPGPNDGRAPLALLPSRSPHFEWDGDEHPRHETDLVIYELHVRGFTRGAGSGVAPARQGTFAGLIDRIPYLIDLGITAVELMPVFQWDPQEGNYWGYMPLSFFAPHQGLACRRDAQHHEFKALVRAMHDAGIEVILDVVYNHTAEGGRDGPTYSFKGIDNSTYYLMTGDAVHPYADFSGTGNTLHTANAAVRRLILDSLRYWVEEMHVDGFRFDLASIFARDRFGAIDLTGPGIFGDIASDPVLATTRLIAEPWDTASHHLGRTFPGVTWFQWNDRFRDDVRRFIRGEPDLVPTVMRRLYGSDDIFPDDREHAFHPYQSINFITSHDGFTLYDLVSYEHKRNWANGHANEDGPTTEHSWNCGWEGDEGVPREVVALRKRQAKNLICLLLLANGTPMLRAGDEFLQTQGGNNNPYNQDNATSWLDWTRLDTHADVHRFVRAMIAFRKAHPSLARSRFWREDVTWLGATEQAEPDGSTRVLAFHLRGRGLADADLYVMINPTSEDRLFRVHDGTAEEWRRVVDTAESPPEDIRETGYGVALAGTEYRVRARSVVVLERHP